MGIKIAHAFQSNVTFKDLHGLESGYLRVNLCPNNLTHLLRKSEGALFCCHATRGHSEIQEAGSWIRWALADPP